MYQYVNRYLNMYRRITCSKNPFLCYKKKKHNNYYYLYADPWWWVNCCSVFYISLLTREKKKHCVQQYLIVSQSVVWIVAAFVLSWQQCLQHDTNCALTDFLCHYLYQPRRALPPVLCDPKMIATIVILLKMLFFDTKTILRIITLGMGCTQHLKNCMKQKFSPLLKKSADVTKYILHNF